jgi:hypothetical protein
MRQDYFSSNNIKYVDYKDIDILKKFLNPNGKYFLENEQIQLPRISANSRSLSNAHDSWDSFHLLRSRKIQKRDGFKSSRFCIRQPLFQKVAI